jgi:uncharacterized membrane protein
MKSSEEVVRAERFSKNRLENLSDGVFGFAMTLLVIDLAIPNIKSISNNAQLWQTLVSEQRAFISFIVAFFVLASMWSLHVRQFEYLEKIDRRFVFINNLRLFLVVLIAFSAGVAGNYQNIELARMILPFNFFLLALVSTWQWYYAAQTKPPLINYVSKKEKQLHLIRAGWFVLFAGLTVVGAYFVGEFAFAVFLLMPLVIRVTGRKSGPIS